MLMIPYEIISSFNKDMFLIIQQLAELIIKYFPKQTQKSLLQKELHNWTLV